MKVKAKVKAEELVEFIYTMHQQNNNEKNDFDKAFKFGIECAVEEIAKSEEPTKAIQYQIGIEYLWQIIDDIDTVSDIAKENDVVYRNMVEKLQKKRWNTGITTDGYKLDFTKMKLPK